MTYGTTIFPALACAFALAAVPAGAGAISDAGTATDRLSSDEIGELRELLVAHGIPPARHLAGEITLEISESNREAATANLYRLPVAHPAAPAPTPAAIVEAGEPASAGPVHASAPRENPSPFRSLLRKVLGFLNFPN